MPTLKNSQGQEFDVSDADAIRMNADDPSLQIVGDVRTSNATGGAPVSVAGDVVANRAGYAPASVAEQAAYSHKLNLKDKTSAVGSAVRGGLSGLSFGISDKLFDPTTTEADQAWHPIARGAGEFAGAIAPGLFGDEAGVAGQIAKDGVQTEHVAGGLSSKFLYGGEAAPGIERSIARAGETIDSAKAASAIPEDLSSLDAAGLRAREEGEVSRLSAEQDAQRAALRSQVVTEAQSFHSQLDDANLYLVTGEGKGSKVFYDQNKKIRYALDDVKTLEEKPGLLLSPLRRQEGALVETLKARDAIQAKIAAKDAKIAAGLAEDLGTEGGLLSEAKTIELEGDTARRYGAWADVKVKSFKGSPKPLTVSREDAQGFYEALQNGEAAGETQQALGKLESVLEANRALQSKVVAATADKVAKGELASPALESIRAAKESLKDGGHSPVMGALIGQAIGVAHGIPIIGPLVGAAAGMLHKNLGKLAAAGMEKSKVAAEAFLNVAKRATPTLPVLASRTLADIAYGPAKKTESKRDLVDNYRARTAEIKAQTAYGPDGKPVMTPDARSAMAARLAPIRAASPILADKLESIGAKRLEYLSSIIPRRPDINGMQIGPDTWQPSDLEMRSFARAMAAAEDPHGVEQRLANGTLTPEDADAYKAVYPERFSALVQQIVTSLPTLQKTLPYSRRLSLSIFSGVAADPSLEPQILQALQAQFKAEDGTDGGDEAPKPKPAFGSVKAEPGTASQQREMGT